MSLTRGITQTQTKARSHNQGVYVASSGWGFLGPSTNKIEPTNNNQQVVHTSVNPTANGFHLTPSSVARVKSQASYRDEKDSKIPSYKSLRERDLRLLIY